MQHRAVCKEQVPVNEMETLKFKHLAVDYPWNQFLKQSFDLGAAKLCALPKMFSYSYCLLLTDQEDASQRTKHFCLREQLPGTMLAIFIAR